MIFLKVRWYFFQCTFNKIRMKFDENNIWKKWKKLTEILSNLCTNANHTVSNRIFPNESSKFFHRTFKRFSYIKHFFTIFEFKIFIELRKLQPNFIKNMLKMKNKVIEHVNYIFISDSFLVRLDQSISRVRSSDSFTCFVEQLILNSTLSIWVLCLIPIESYDHFKKKPQISCSKNPNFRHNFWAVKHFLWFFYVFFSISYKKSKI